MSKLKLLFFLFSIVIVNYSCNKNKRLSPINIETSDINDNLKSIYTDYLPSPDFVINNTGQSIDIYVTNSELIVPSDSNYQGIQYTLRKIMIKSLSEHTVKGEHYPLELQLCHIDEDSDSVEVIVSIFVEEGNENPFLQKIVSHIPQKGTPSKQDISVDPYNILPNSPKFWKYNGTQTEKPYDFEIVWYIMQEPIQASAEQIKIINSSIGANDIGVVELGNRKISEF